MAKFISDPSITSQIKEDFANQTFNRYNTFLNQRPMYVEYFSMDEVSSNFDRSLHGVETLLGDDSPLKFVKLVDFPLYQFNTSGASTTTSDLGSLEVEVTGQAVILSEHGTPKVDDMFVITDIYTNVRNIYRVNQADLSKVNGHPVYQISFYLYVDQQVVVDELYNQVSATYAPTINNSTDSVKFVPVDKAAIIAELKVLADGLKESYSNMFHDKLTGQFSFQKDGQYIYDPVGIYFMRTCNAFKRYSYYRNEKFFAPKQVPLSLEVSKKLNIWHAIVRRDKNLLTDANYLTLLPIEVVRDSLYYGYPVKVSVPMYVADTGGVIQSTPIYGNFKDYVASTDDQTTSDVIPTEYASLFKKHINRNLDETSLLEVMRRIEIEYEFLDFFMIPVLIYVTDQKIQELVTNS